MAEPPADRVETEGRLDDGVLHDGLLDDGVLHEGLLDDALLDELSGLAAGLARRAADLLLEGMASVPELLAAERIGTKTSATDMVSEVDRASERLLVDGILAARPDDGILGEEGTDRPGRSGVRWVIDPLDGTTNFLYGLPGFAVSIGVEIAGRSVAGAVLDPVQDELFEATLGRGATRNGAAIHCTMVGDLGLSLIGTGFGYEATVRARQADVLRTILPAVRDIRRFGAAAVDLCSVACGRLDGYYEVGLQPWDLAAGGLIATEAGAVLGGLDGGRAGAPLTVAAGPGIARALRALLSQAGLPASREAGSGPPRGSVTLGQPEMRHSQGVGTRILTVEDDERIRTAVRMALEDEGWDVDESESGEQALEAFAADPSDVVLIDLMLPGIDGFELCRSIRRTSDVPILMVTARADTHDVVAGLEAGADDYVTKPFQPKELSARIRALLRRARSTEPVRTRLRFGDLEIIPDDGVVRRDGEEIHLTKTEFRLLCELASSSGRVFSREQLLDRIWGYDYFGDGRLVDVHIRRLRTKVEHDPAHPQHVVTVRGLGYKLNG